MPAFPASRSPISTAPRSKASTYAPLSSNAILLTAASTLSISWNSISRKALAAGLQPCPRAAARPSSTSLPAPAMRSPSSISPAAKWARAAWPPPQQVYFGSGYSVRLQYTGEQTITSAGTGKKPAVTDNVGGLPSKARRPTSPSRFTSPAIRSVPRFPYASR